MAKRRNEEPERRAPLTDDEKQWMLSVFIRRPDAFEVAREMLRADHFDPEHEGYMAVIWSIACDHYDEFQTIPKKSMVLAQFNGRIEQDPDVVTEESMDDADELLDLIWGLRKADLKEAVAFAWLQRFLEDRMVDQVREDLSMPQTPKDVAAMFAKRSEEAQAIAGLSAGPIRAPFAPGWDEKGPPITIHPTGFAFLDTFMDGGHAAKQTHGLLGPYQGGKTTMGTMMSLQIAHDEHERWEADPTKPRGICYHFSYEEPEEDLQIRGLSYLAQIPKKTLIRALTEKDYSIFSKGRNLKRYERRLFSNEISRGSSVYAERERFKLAIDDANACLRFVDMTGADDEHPGRGYGLVDEVASIVRRDQMLFRQAGENTRVACVLVDYVGAALERHLDFHGKDHGEMRHMVRAWPMHMKHKVAIPFDCPVWSLHQLKAAANSYRPGQVPQITDSAEGQAWGENLDFSFMLGKGTHDGHAVFVCNKHRRTKPRKPIIVQLDGGMATFHDTRGEWVLDEGSRQIIRAEEYHRIHGDGAEETVEEEVATEAVAAAQQQSVTRRRRRRRPRGEDTV